MATNSKNKKVANKLLSLSLDEEGKVNKEKVQSVLASLRENPPSNHREILQHYLTATRRYLPSFQCGLEVPAGVDDQVNQTLSAKVNDSEGSKLLYRKVSKPEFDRRIQTQSRRRRLRGFDRPTIDKPTQISFLTTYIQ